MDDQRYKEEPIDLSHFFGEKNKQETLKKKKPLNQRDKIYIIITIICFTLTIIFLAIFLDKNLFGKSSVPVEEFYPAEEGIEEKDSKDELFINP